MKFFNKILCRTKLPLEKSYQMVQTDKAKPPFIPAAIYIDGETKSILARKSDIMKALMSKKKKVLLFLNGKTIIATIQKIQKHPVSFKPTHISFQAILI